MTDPINIVLAMISFGVFKALIEDESFEYKYLPLAIIGAVFWPVALGGYIVSLMSDAKFFDRGTKREKDREAGK